MSGTIRNRWTYAVTYLEQAFGAQTLGSASGFFWSAYGKTFLVSNWHVFSGRHPDTSYPLATHAGVPDRLRMSLFKRVSPGPSAGQFRVHPVTAEVKLYTDDSRETPCWLEHPSRQGKIDVAAIDITKVLALDEYAVAHVNQLEGDVVAAPEVAQDAFVVGYPLGVISSVPIPVWKRGSIATEPLVDIDGYPKLLIDTATRSGMSGAITIVKHVMYGPYDKRDGTRSDTIVAEENSILGVYSGRLGVGEVNAQLGIVWKRCCIEEVLQVADRSDA
jgi:hypothetical protein